MTSKNPIERSASARKRKNKRTELTSAPTSDEAPPGNIQDKETTWATELRLVTGNVLASHYSMTIHVEYRGVGGRASSL